MPYRPTRVLLVLFVACVGIAIWPVASLAGDYRRCCFRVHVESAGYVHTDWGADPAKQVNGYHKLRWAWATRQLMSYHETGGFRQLGDACRQARSRRVCARDKVSAWFHEESHIIESPGDPALRHDRGSCTNDVTAGRNASAWVNSRGAFQVAISVPKQNGTGRSLVFANAGPNVVGASKFQDRCWFGVGDHPSTGHEPGADVATNETASTWELIVDAPGRASFRRNRRFIEPGGTSFSHDVSYHNNWSPHTTTRNSVTEVRFTPFPRSQLAREIRALNELR